MHDLTCQHCGTPMKAQRVDNKWCSKACGAKHRRAHPPSTCSVNDCDKGSIAKGLCSTHYNRTQGEAKRHPKQTVTCVVCQTPVRRRKDSEGRYQPTCSVACRTIVQHGNRVAQTSSYEWRTDAVARARENGCHIVQVFDREDIFERDAWLCQDCGIQCAAPNPFDRTAATVDHVVPLRHGGEHSKANAQTLCLSCNARKADRLAIAPAA